MRLKLNPETDRRVRRGGSWYYTPPGMRGAHSYGIAPGYILSNIAFRICCGVR